MSAVEEVHEFLKSGEIGIVSKYTVDTLNRAQQKMFTANGLTSPIKVVQAKGQTYIIRRDAMLNA